MERREVRERDHLPRGRQTRLLGSPRLFEHRRPLDRGSVRVIATFRDVGHHDSPLDALNKQSLTTEIKVRAGNHETRRKQRGEFRSQKAMIGFFLVSWFPA